MISYPFSHNVNFWKKALPEGPAQIGNDSNLPQWAALVTDFGTIGLSENLEKGVY